MPEVLLGDLDGHPAGDRVAGVRVPHPVRACLGEAFRALRIAVPSQHTGAVVKCSNSVTGCRGLVPS